MRFLCARSAGASFDFEILHNPLIPSCSPHCDTLRGLTGLMCVTADFNAFVTKLGNGSMVMVALKDISAGEEVCRCHVVEAQILITGS